MDNDNQSREVSHLFEIYTLKLSQKLGAIEKALTNLEQSTKEIKKELDVLKDDTKTLKDAHNNLKTTKKFIIDNFLNLKIPVVILTLFFGGSYLHELPSSSQQQLIKELQLALE